MIKGPANEPVPYGMKASGATSVFGGGQATAFLYLDGTLLNYALLVLHDRLQRRQRRICIQHRVFGAFEHSAKA
jgi:hypothetical protein